MMISIIVPVYKVEPYLRQCVDSILNQTYRNIEVLLIDDGSPDKCGEICDEYERKDKRVRVFHTENRGLSAARNLGLKEAVGDYIGFVDSDDWIEPDMYECLIGELKKYEADIVIGGSISTYESDEKGVKKKVDHTVYQSTESLEALLDREINDQVWNKLYRAELVKQICFPEGRNYEDIATLYKVFILAKRTVVVPKYLYYHRQRKNSISKMNTAENLLDCAYAYLSRFYFFKDSALEFEERKQVEEKTEISDPAGWFEMNKNKLLCGCARGIFKVWRCWYSNWKENKQSYTEQIEELKNFSQENFSIFMPGKLPVYIRFSIIFMKSSSLFSFVFLNTLNTIFELYRNKDIYDCCSIQGQ